MRILQVQRRISVLSILCPVLIVGCNQEKRLREAHRIEAEQREAKLAQQVADLDAQCDAVTRQLAGATSAAEKAALQKKLDELNIEAVRQWLQMSEVKNQRARQISQEMEMQTISADENQPPTPFMNNDISCVISLKARTASSIC